MNALTLIQPWASAIAHDGKWIENRTWTPPLRALGQPLAIHAGAKWDNTDAWHLQHELSRAFNRKTEPRSAVIAVARLIGWALGPEQGNALRCADGVDGDALRARSPATDRWFAGPVGWLLADVVPLTVPVPCAGMMGVWRLPPAVEALVYARSRR